MRHTDTSISRLLSSQTARSSRQSWSFSAVALLVVTGLGLSLVAAGHAQESAEARVRVEKRVIMVDGDGKVIELDGDAVTTHGGIGGDEHDAFVWVSDDASGATFSADVLVGLSGGFLGVETVELTDALRAHFGVPAGEGVLISNVVDDSGAMIGGVVAGDVITGVAGSSLSSSSDLGKLVRQHEPGETVDLEIWRDGKLVTVPVQLGERKRSTLHMDRQGASFQFKILGAGDEVNTFEFRSEDAVEDVLKYFDGPEWRERVKRLETMDLDQVEERMRELEAKIKSLEKQLEEGAETTSGSRRRR